MSGWMQAAGLIMCGVIVIGLFATPVIVRELPPLAWCIPGNERFNNFMYGPGGHEVCMEAWRQEQTNATVRRVG